MKPANPSVLLIIINLFIATALYPQEKLSPEQLRSDFMLTRKALEEIHPGLYRYHTKAEMDSIFDKNGELITTEMTEQEFYRFLLPVLAQIKCGHTKLIPEKNVDYNYYYGYDRLFPLRLYIKDNKGFVAGNYTNGKEPLTGFEIYSINGRPMNEILKVISVSSFSDGDINTFKELETGKFFSAWYANIMGSPDTFLIEYNTHQGLMKAKLKAISYATVKQHNDSITAISNKVQPYSLNFPGDDIACITIKSFWMNGDKKFRNFLNHSFDEIRRRNINHLIIDVRDNEGGIDKRGSMLLSHFAESKFNYYDRIALTTNQRYTVAKYADLPKFYGILRLLIAHPDSGIYLWKHKKNLKMQHPYRHSYINKVYILINGASFSVTAEFAAVVHSLNRAVFIGEETGGAYQGNNSGTFTIIHLPNSRLNLGIPMLAYYMAVKPNYQPQRGIIPDYEVKQTIDDILNGSDRVMQFTLKLIEENNTP